MRTYLLIPCRMESVRYPNKPMLDILGLPMFAHVYYRARLAAEDYNGCHVYVCTDSAVIMESCNELGIPVIPTSTLHVNGTERIAEAARWLKAADDDIIVNVQGDDPLIDPDDIEELMNEHFGRPEVDVFLPHVAKEEPGDELGAKMVTNRKNKVLYISRSPIPSNYRQVSEYKKTLSIYSFRNDALQAFANTPETELEKNEGVETLRPIDMGLDVYTFPLSDSYQPIDVPEHYEIVKELMKNDKWLDCYHE